VPDIANITRIPAPRVPVIEGPDGVMSRPWYRYFTNVFTLLGVGQNAVTLTDLQVAPAVETPHLHLTRYGMFYDTTTQTAAAANTAYGMTVNTTAYSLGVTIGTPTSRIYVDRPGMYNIQFSAQLDRTAATTGLIYIWLRVNGVDVAHSAGQIRIQGNNAETLAAWNYLQQLNAGDYFEIMWSADDTSSQILASGAVAPVPAIPSVIISVSDNI